MLIILWKSRQGSALFWNCLGETLLLHVYILPHKYILKMYFWREIPIGSINFTYCISWMNYDGFPLVLDHRKTERWEDKRSLLTPLPRKRKYRKKNRRDQIKWKQLSSSAEHSLIFFQFWPIKILYSLIWTFLSFVPFLPHVRAVWDKKYSMFNHANKSKLLIFCCF